jgi:hypothetical protein
MARKSNRDKWFDETVALPPGFGGVSVIRRAIEYMERELADLVEIYFEQANVFSAIVGILGTRALDSGQQLGEKPARIHRSAAFSGFVPTGLRASAKA